MKPMAPAITKIGTDRAKNAAPITSRVLGALSSMPKSYSFDIGNNRTNRSVFPSAPLAIHWPNLRLFVPESADSPKNDGSASKQLKDSEYRP